MSILILLNNEKFFKYQESIKVLYLIDDIFRGMCDDYCYSKTNAEKYKQNKNSDFQLKIVYQNLAKELEEEILLYLLKNTE